MYFSPESLQTGYGPVLTHVSLMSKAWFYTTFTFSLSFSHSCHDQTGCTTGLVVMQSVHGFRHE